MVVVCGETVDPGEVITACREKLAKFTCPSSVEVVDELPRNPTGKVLMKELRTTFGG